MRGTREVIPTCCASPYRSMALKVAHLRHSLRYPARPSPAYKSPPSPILSFFRFLVTAFRKSLAPRNFPLLSPFLPPPISESASQSLNRYKVSSHLNPTVQPGIVSSHFEANSSHCGISALACNESVFAHFARCAMSSQLILMLDVRVRERSWRCQ